MKREKQELLHLRYTNLFIYKFFLHEFPITLLKVYTLEIKLIVISKRKPQRPILISNTFPLLKIDLHWIDYQIKLPSILRVLLYHSDIQKHWKCTSTSARSFCCQNLSEREWFSTNCSALDSPTLQGLSISVRWSRWGSMWGQM